MVSAADYLKIIITNNSNLIYFFSINETPATIDFPITEPQELLKALDNNTRVIFFIFGYHQLPNSSNVQLMLEGIGFLYNMRIIKLLRNLIIIISIKGKR